MRRSLEAVAVLGLLVALRSPADATFHIVSISEIGSGFNGAADVQFVELRLDLGAQTNATNTRLTVFAADGTAILLKLSDHPLANGTSGANVLYATAAFRTATGVKPDFEISTGIVTPTGMICWGAPGIVPPPPASWDFTKPENYVDCVAYGGFTGTTRPASGTPSALPPATVPSRSHQGTSKRQQRRLRARDPERLQQRRCLHRPRHGAAVCGDADGSGSVTVTDGVRRCGRRRSRPATSRGAT
jgi:hypothetical protein